jgi:hypothetical protein
MVLHESTDGDEAFDGDDWSERSYKQDDFLRWQLTRSKPAQHKCSAPGCDAVPIVTYRHQPGRWYEFPTARCPDHRLVSQPEPGPKGGGGGWSDDELRVAVQAYRHMLEAEQAGQPYSKSKIRKQLVAGPLSARNESSVERRMANISAVLDALDRPWIAGYKPYRHTGKKIEGRIEALLREYWPELGGAPPPGGGPAKVCSIPVGSFQEEEFETSGTEPGVATQRESKLVKRYEAWLRESGDHVTAREYWDNGPVLRCDLFNHTRNQLVEAKADATRERARMAVGQLLDYEQFEDTKPALAILVPAKPSASILRYLEHTRVAAVWAVGDGVVDNVGGRFASAEA